VSVTAGCVLRQPLGRRRPDLAALLSIDHGLTFERTYSSGKVGPFSIEDRRSVTRQRLPAFAEGGGYYPLAREKWWTLLLATVRSVDMSSEVLIRIDAGAGCKVGGASIAAMLIDTRPI
jgi:hypothetical protein